MKSKLLLVSLMMLVAFSCTDKTNVVDENEKWGDREGSLNPTGNVESKNSRTESVASTNPYGLAVSIHSPYGSYRAETNANWGPPSHWKPWGGDWAGDFWKDNGNSTGDYPNSCGNDVFLDARPLQYPGGQKPTTVKAKLVAQGYACASANYWDGGYMQKWQIYGVYNGIQYDLGWVLYAHLDNMVYPVNTVLTLTGRVKIGTAFQGGNIGACWGSCHIHMEFFNNLNWSCYCVLPPTVDINRVGVIGGLSPSAQHCPSFASTVNLALSSVNCARSSAYSSSYDCNKAYDNVVSAASKWTSNGSSPESWMSLDLGGTKSIKEFVVKHAGAAGEATYFNTKYFRVEYSNTSITGPWTVASYADNSGQANITSIPVNISARYVRLYITNAGIDNYARIPEFQVMGN